IIMRQPDFDNIRRILDRSRAKRPTLFEFFLNQELYEKLVGESMPELEEEKNSWLINAFRAAGYDYATIHPPKGMQFKTKEHDAEGTYSLNDYNIISDRKSFENYQWPDPDKCDYSIYDKLTKHLPDGMKAIVCGPGGVLENTIALLGYDNMCIMTLTEPKLLEDVFAKVGSTLVRHYELASQFDSVGALISNDDWGFNSQTMLSPEDFEKYLFPWHRKIAAACHKAGKPVILHSCGQLEKIMDVIIDDIGYDGKHSYEDKIMPIEEAYEKYHSRIALLGGIDLDFVCRHTPDEVYQRSRKMIERSAERGSYALGTGNSVPEYTPDENYFAMTKAALI
ncbi:MAG: uroporphyrinogen decarboxylase family protein, partial [Victivallales bacterium]|nr:uroporphyrinogen decarboxylase family protein [Victivallales bacterium]